MVPYNPRNVQIHLSGPTHDGCDDFLLKGNEESITADVVKRIEIGRQNKGFILSTACSIAPNVPKENIELLAKIASEIGSYNDP